MATDAVENGAAPAEPRSSSASPAAGSNGSSKRTLEDPVMRSMARKLITNFLTTRTQLMQKMMDPHRDVDAECGHAEEIADTDYQRMFERDAVTNRVVKAFPTECWQVQYEIYDDEDVGVETEFEKAVKGLPRQLAGRSKFKPRCGGSVNEYLKRADIVSGIGRYGILLLGLNDKKPLRNEALPANGMKLTFLRAFSEFNATVAEWDESLASPRFGQPVSYDLNLHDPRKKLQPGDTQKFERVHWSRVIHVADNVTECEWAGEPRAKPVFNNLQDLKKLYGGSGEMYWRGAFPGLSMQSHPTLGDEADLDSEELKEQIELYMMGLQRYLATVGMDVKSLAPQVVDPTPQIMAQIQAICIQLGMPLRIFMGSERGQLASLQDDSNWRDRVKERHYMYLSPRVVAPFYDQLIYLNVLPAPQNDEYNIWWPDIASVNKKDRAAIAFQLSQCLAQYVTAEIELAMPLLEFFVTILGMDREEAQACVKALKANKERLVPPPTATVEKAKADKVAADAKVAAAENAVGGGTNPAPSAGASTAATAA